MKNDLIKPFRCKPTNITKDIWYYENSRSISVVVWIGHERTEFRIRKAQLKKILSRMD